MTECNVPCDVPNGCPVVDDGKIGEGTFVPREEAHTLLFLVSVSNCCE